MLTTRFPLDLTRSSQRLPSEKIAKEVSKKKIKMRILFLFTLLTLLILVCFGKRILPSMKLHPPSNNTNKSKFLARIDTCSGCVLDTLPVLKEWIVEETRKL